MKNKCYYLTSADYNDGLANENPSWSYDAAGNRNDVTAVDNLNRATTISGVNRTYDILGNTLTKGSTTTYTWDVLNRMLSHTASSVTTNYAYRADGMRVTKDNGTTLSRFYYDGQMPIETTETTSSATVVTRNGLGARGIDRIERVGASSTVGYPIYDGHGNMVATLAKSGSSYSLGDQRSYDAWGVVRSGNSTGDPKGRFVAKLGHTDDDESDFVYMRARYYEKTCGRFIASDPMMDGINCYVYAGNDPVNRIDTDGRISFKDFNDMAKKFFDMLRMMGIPSSLIAIPSVATIVIKLFIDLQKWASIAVEGQQLALMGLAMSAENPFLGAGMTAAGGTMMLLATAISLLEIYSACLAIYLIIDDAAGEYFGNS